MYFWKKNLIFALLILTCLSYLTCSETNINIHTSQLIWEFISQKCPLWIEKILWILYDVKDGEGFYLQKNVFYRMALTVAILNQNFQERNESKLAALVLPPFCNISHWSFNKERRLRWSKFYRINLNRILILEYDTLKALIGSVVFETNVVGINFNWSYNSVEKNDFFQIYNRSEVYRNKYFDSNCNFDKYIKNGKTVFAGYCEYIRITNLFCLNYYKLMRSKEISNSIYELNKLNKQWKGLSCFLIKHADGILVAWPWELKKYELLDTLQHSDYIKMKSNLYMSKNAFFFKKAFIGIHLRRKDFVIVRNNEIPTFNQVFERVTEISRKLKIKHLLISTDGDEQEKKLLKDLFKNSGITLHIIDVYFEPEDGIMSAISQYILLKAKYFIGTKDSRFSSSVSWDCILKEKSKISEFKPNFEICNEYFCAKNEGKHICREHNDRLPI